MRKFFKAVAAALVPVLACGIGAVNTSAYEVGDVIGKILFTDIVAYVEGTRVRSYNIKGRTAIVAQDLRALGAESDFEVMFDEETRVLTITNNDIYSPDSSETVVFDESASSLPVGTAVGDVLYTDITTNFDGEMMESFNIGGLTCIYADDLGKLCGSYLWDENERTVNVFRNGSYIPYVAKTDAQRKLPAENTVITRDETMKRWASPNTSQLIKNSDGTYTAIDAGEHINLEKYDASFNLISSFAIKKELPIFGAFYQGKDYNYIAYGQENLLEDNSREVIRIVIYDKNFVKISEIPISNCKTAIPFDASGASLSENDKYLVLHTSRSQYLDENNSRPQTQLTVIIDKATWKPCNVLGKFQYNHISHSLQQFVTFDNERIITANYSDAAPIRGAFLQEIDSSGRVLFTQSIFNVGGPLGMNATGGMIGGISVSDKGYLVTMNTVDHSLPLQYSNTAIEGIPTENRDIYLLWTDKETYEMRHTCLARYTGVGLTGSAPYIVKLSDGNFMVLWQRFFDADVTSNDMCYAFFDGEGRQLGKTYTVKGQLSSSCAPIESDGRVVWYVNDESGRSFYSVNAYLPPETEKEETLVVQQPEEKPEEIIPEIPEKEEANENREEENKNTEVDGI